MSISARRIRQEKRDHAVAVAGYLVTSCVLLLGLALAVAL